MEKQDNFQMKLIKNAALFTSRRSLNILKTAAFLGKADVSVSIMLHKNFSCIVTSLPPEYA